MISRRALIFSGCLHIALMLLVSYWGLWGRKRDFDIPPPIVVELAEVSEITQTNRVTPTPTPPKEEEKPVPDSASKKPPKVDTAAPPDTTSAAEPEDAVPLPPDPKEEKKPEEKKPVKKPPVPQRRPKPPAPKPDAKKEEENKEFASVLRNLVGEENPQAPTNEQQDMNLNEKPAPGQMAPLGEKLTVSEADALRRQLESCWNVPIGAQDAENLVIEIRLVVNPDRTVRQASIVNQSRYNQDDFFRAAADSAIRAVRHPNCSPLALPEDKYNQWQNIVVTFNPKEMF